MISALLLGDASCVEADTEAALKLFTPDVVGATNNIGVYWPGTIDHWFTLHPAACEDWIGIYDARSRRERAGLNRPVTWSYKAWRGVDHVRQDWAGSTGLFGVKCLLEIGCERIVLAGVPMQAEFAHYYTPFQWKQANLYHKAWKARLSEIAPYVRSMNGWTRELLGAPDEEWLGALTAERRSA
jgi:hypothetical protein